MDNILKKLRSITPHIAILTANMYYVFWGIDRVNKSMNFIDNVYTKIVFAIMMIFDIILIVSTLREMSTWSRGKAQSAAWMRTGLAAGLALFEVIYAVLWLVDIIRPHRLIFRNEFVKVLLLIYCIFSTLNGIYTIACDRVEYRRRQRLAARRARSNSSSNAGRPAGRYDSGSSGRYASTSGSSSRSRSSGSSNRYASSSGSSGRSRSSGSSGRYEQSSKSPESASSRRRSRYDDYEF